VLKVACCLGMFVDAALLRGVLSPDLKLTLAASMEMLEVRVCTVLCLCTVLCTVSYAVYCTVLLK
jgi:hypothetical protein